MKRICLQAFIGMITAWTAVSCSSEPAACGCGDDGSTIPVSFTMNTPAGEAVPYGTTRATHDEAEWTIHRLTLYVYSVDDAGRGTFLRRYATDASGDQAISIVSNGAGTYNFTLKAPVSDLKARQPLTNRLPESRRTSWKTNWQASPSKRGIRPTNSLPKARASPCRASHEAIRATS